MSGISKASPVLLCPFRVAVVGNVDAGKSTLLGVLTHGELDNGRGFARQKLFRHKHEMESGRTSSVGNDILGFDQEGQVRARYKTSVQRVSRKYSREGRIECSCAIPSARLYALGT